MDTILEQLIADFHYKGLTAFTRRHVKLHLPAWLWALSLRDSVI